MKILHFSDIHLGLGLDHVPLRDWPGKRLAGGLNLLRGRQRRFAGTPEKVRRLAELARAEGVDLVLFSGDFTAMGTDAELAAARAIVQPFTEVSAGFTCVPGNHDLYASDVLREKRFERHFGEFLLSDIPGLRADGPWPLVRLIGSDLAVVAVNSARPNPAPWRSSGRVPDEQIEGLRQVLEHPAVGGRTVLVITHYAPCLPDGGPDHRNHRMENAREFLDACACIGSGAILCGHVHRTYRVRLPGIGPDILCAGSATMKPHEGFWLLETVGGQATARRGRWTGNRFELESHRSARLGRDAQ